MSKPTRFTQEMTDAYVADGFWANETTLDLLDGHANARPDDIAVVDQETRLTWSAARDAVARFAHRLDQLGLERDTPVVVQLQNTVESCLVRLALKRVGLLGSYVPIVWRRGELEAVNKVLRPGAILVPGQFRDLDTLAVARELREISPELKIVVIGVAAQVADCVCLSLNDDVPAGPPPDDKKFSAFEVTKLVVTSGSTGVPKLVERPEQQEILWGRGAAQRLGLTSTDSVGCFAPLSGGLGFHSWAAWLVSGAKFVLSDGFGPQTLLPLIEQERITVVMTAPAILAPLAEWPDLDSHDLSTLRVIRAGAAKLPSSVVKTAETRLDCLVVRAGGAMEGCSFGQTSIDDPAWVRHGESIGKPMPGGEILIVDPAGQPLPAGSLGELWIRGPGTSSGYFRDPKTTAEAWGTLGPDGWFRTGDVATIDDEGYVTLIGRIKEMINRGGSNIYPLELEGVLAEHPNIVEAAVVGLPDRRLGEVPCLCVIPGGGSVVTLDEVTDFLRARELASYKFPTRVVLFEDFPRGQTMRVNRRQLAADVIAELGLN